MIQRFVRRKGLALGVSCLGVTAMVMMFAGTANAAGPSPAQNNTVVEGGSNTAYTTMVALGSLFDISPGCNLVVASGDAQSLDYSCASPSGPGGENGLGPDKENPFNDVAVQEPAYGSSNGILELECDTQVGTAPCQSHGSSVPVAAINAARSSRAPNNGLNGTSASDSPGLNFVAYAEDAVPWFHFTEAQSKATPSAKVTSLSITQLAAIYNGSITNWDKVGGTNAPIRCYMAQSGSGTESTWATALSLTSATPKCLSLEPNPSGHVIFENEDANIIKNGDEADAIFYYSFGKFTVDCVASTGTCNGAHPSGKNKVAEGDESVTTGGKAIAPSATTIQNGTYPIIRFLYNVYGNGTQADVPVATQATLNFVSEYGFLCKPGTATQTDSNTGLTYRSEIDTVLKDQGFVPFLLGPMGDTAGGYTHAVISNASYAADDGYPADVGKKGYCKVFTTDGDGVSPF
jgi:hypothetical protein